MPAETHSHSGDLDRAAVLTIVVDRLAELVGRDPDEIDRDTQLRTGLGLDDLGVIDLLEAVEDEVGERTVGVRLDDEDLAELVTVGDVVDAIAAYLEGAA